MLHYVNCAAARRQAQTLRIAAAGAGSGGALHPATGLGHAAALRLPAGHKAFLSHVKTAVIKCVILQRLAAAGRGQVPFRLRHAGLAAAPLLARRYFTVRLTFTESWLTLCEAVFKT